MEVKATDADDPNTANGELRYSLINDGEGAFEIHTETGGLDVTGTHQETGSTGYFTHLCPSAGLISSKINTLDRETKSQYVVVVKAQDMRGLPSGSTATTSVTITVADINDNIASFSQGEKESSNRTYN